MNQYELSQFGNVPSGSWNVQSPSMYAPPYAQVGQGHFGSPLFAGPQTITGSPFQQGPQIGQQQEYSPFVSQGIPHHLSPQEFSGSLERGSQLRQAALTSVDAIFVTELSRCARGLQDVADHVESREPDGQRKGLYSATAHLFYAFGLLSSHGVFIPGDLPGKTRSEGGGVSNACREFGKELDRFVDKYATGRGLIEELSPLVERGKLCYQEITKSVEEGTGADQTARKKIA